MRIGIMLRSMDRPGGIGIYSKNVLKHLLGADSDNEYVLAYSDKRHLGEYGHLKNVEEAVIPKGSKLLWDQWQVPRIFLKRKVDVVFNTKFSVPLWGRAKRVMALHGASWFAYPELYKRLDIAYVKYAMPIYCNKADFLVSNSQLTTRDFQYYLNVPESKIRTIRLAAADEFYQPADSEADEHARDRYGIPDDYFLTVTSYDKRKNFGTLIRAFSKFLKEGDVDLVVAGQGCERYADDYDLRKMGVESRVHFIGWVEQPELPCLYRNAIAFVFPSIYEEFGIPVVESMASGCPVISSNTGAIPELTDGAGLLCDPFDEDEFADNMKSIAGSGGLRSRLRKKGRAQARKFSWHKCARETLEVLEQVVNG